MNISFETRQAYFEVDYIIELLSDYEKNKIPKKLRDFFKREKYDHYEKNININDIIENKSLKKETLALVAFLNIKYTFFLTTS
jgi:5'-3' exonuclease